MLNPLRSADQAALAMIDQHGWMVQSVLDNPLYCYTIGLTLKGQPELLMVGLGGQPFMGGFLNLVGTKLCEGMKIVNGRSDDVLEGYPVAFRALTPSAIDARCGGLFNLLGDKTFRVLHMVFPDQQHRFPWEPDAGYQIQMALNLDYLQ